MKNPTSPHHHNGKPELEQHIHAYNPLFVGSARRGRVRAGSDRGGCGLLVVAATILPVPPAALARVDDDAVVRLILACTSR